MRWFAHSEPARCCPLDGPNRASPIVPLKDSKTFSQVAPHVLTKEAQSCFNLGRWASSNELPNTIDEFVDELKGSQYYFSAG